MIDFQIKIYALIKLFQKKSRKKWVNFYCSYKEIDKTDDSIIKIFINLFELSSPRKQIILNFVNQS